MSVETPAGPAQPPLIYGRMVQVMAGIGAIGKNGTNEEAGYTFRSVDDVVDAVHDLLVRHEVFAVPHKVLDRKISERPAYGGGAVTAVHVVQQYRFYATDGSYVEAEIPSEGIDVSDKATNKALTAAYKYLMLQAFAIRTDSASRGSGMYDGDRDHIQRPVASAPAPSAPAKGPAPARGAAPAFVANDRRVVATFINQIGRATTEKALNGIENSLRNLASNNKISPGDKAYLWRELEQRRANLGLPYGQPSQSGPGEAQVPAEPPAEQAPPADSSAADQPVQGTQAKVDGDGFTADDPDTVEMFADEIAAIGGDASAAQLDSLEDNLAQLLADGELSAKDHAHLLQTLRLSCQALGLPAESAWQTAPAGVAE